MFPAVTHIYSEVIPVDFNGIPSKSLQDFGFKYKAEILYCTYLIAMPILIQSSLSFLLFYPYSS